MTDDTQDQEPELDPRTAAAFAADGMSPRKLRSLNPGCVFPLMIVLWVMGYSLYSTVGPNAAISAPQSAASQSNPQDSALGVIQPSSTGNSSSTPAAPAPTPTPDNSGQQTPSDQTPSNPTPSGQTPTQQASPPPADNTPPPPSCTLAYPSEIDISGGDPGVISGQGGNFTSTSGSPVLQASVDNCGDGHHFEISWSASITNADGSSSTANGTDCQMSQFYTTLSDVLSSGWAVSVQMILPVNGCG